METPAHSERIRRDAAAGERPGRHADGRRREAAAQAGQSRRHSVGLDGLIRRLDASLGSDRVDRYFRRDARLSVDGSSLLVVVPTPFHAGLIERRFGPLLRDLVTESFGPGFQLSLRVDAEQFRDSGEQAITTTQPARPAATAARRQASPAKAASRASLRLGEKIDSRFDLDRFMVGSSNRVAYDAAVRMSEGSGEAAFQRLFVHGDCGVGKSHLIRGIARRLQIETHGRGQMRCISAETFTNEYIHAVQQNRVDAFRRRHRRLDLLCLDDVHFLAGKNATQVELLHTLDAIELDGARLVLASDEHPHQIRELSRALASRFVSGMVVEIGRPELELRERLVREFAHRRGLMLTSDAVTLLASGVGREWSAREIEGAMTRLHAAASLDLVGGGQLSAEIVERLLRGADEHVSSAPIRYERIRESVCEPLTVDPSDLGRSGRHPRVVMARAIITLLCRELTSMSYPEIARALGKRNHSTVITAHRRIEQQLEDVVTLGLRCDGLTIGQLRDRMRNSVRSGGPGSL